MIRINVPWTGFTSPLRWQCAWGGVCNTSGGHLRYLDLDREVASTAIGQVHSKARWTNVPWADKRPIPAICAGMTHCLVRPGDCDCVITTAGSYLV